VSCGPGGLFVSSFLSSLSADNNLTTAGVAPKGRKVATDTNAAPDPLNDPSPVSSSDCKILTGNIEPSSVPSNPRTTGAGTGHHKIVTTKSGQGTSRSRSRGCGGSGRKQAANITIEGDGDSKGKGKGNGNSGDDGDGDGDDDGDGDGKGDGDGDGDGGDGDGDGDDGEGDEDDEEPEFSDAPELPPTSTDRKKKVSFLF